MKVHFEGGGPNANAFTGPDRLIGAGDGDAVQPHFGRDEADERGAFAQSEDIGHGAAEGLIGKMFLVRGNGFIADEDLVGAAHGDHGFFEAVFHAFDDGGHADEAGDAEDDAEHGEERAEFVRPDILDPDENGVEQRHAVTRSARLGSGAGGWL
jgi:hypothetical protein